MLHTRAELLSTGNRLHAELYRTQKAEDWETFNEVYGRLREVEEAYEGILTKVSVARCPFTDALVKWPIDTGDLDGWFWRRKVPLRNDPDPPPGLWLAMDGSMRLREPLTPMPFDCRPGPSLPTVLPYILERPDTKAVIAEVPVGKHTGWAVTYFGPQTQRVLVNTWGDQWYQVYDDDGNHLGWNSNDAILPEERDFDLEPWLRNGKLLWIAPGDESAELHHGPDGCPYLDIPGPRYRSTYISDTGEVGHSP